MDQGTKAVLVIALIILILAVAVAWQWVMHFRITRLEKSHGAHADIIEPLKDMQKFRGMNQQFSHRSNGVHHEKRA